MEATQYDHLTREVAIQAELLALNFALEGEGAEQASAALIALSRELREAGRNRPGASESARSVWRLED
jgi:hypothetical protein